MKLAFSKEDGDTFGEPLRVHRTDGNEQVTVVWLPEKKVAAVGWLEDESFGHAASRQMSDREKP